MKVGSGVHATQRCREGVVLLVVVTLLTLFEIVGISFVSYADTDKPGTRQFRPDVSALTHQTLVLAEDLADDLRRSEREPVDFWFYLSRIDDLDDDAEGVETRIRTALERETDPTARTNLETLDCDIKAFLEELDDLRWLVEQLARGE
jgi:hypothetical protein